MRSLALFFIMFSFLRSCDPYDQDIGAGFRFSSDIHGKPVDDIFYDWSNISNPCSAIVFHDSLNNVNIVPVDSFHYVYSIVDMYVDDFEYNDEFIVVEQKPRLLFESYISKKGMDFKEAKKEGLWDEFDIYEYWIVLKNTCEVYGPLSYNQYELYKTELNVPNSLKLRRERNSISLFFEGVISIILLLLSVLAFLCLLAMPAVSVVLIFRYVRKRMQI